MPVAAARTVRSCLSLVVAVLALSIAAPAAHAQDEPPYLYWDNSWAQTIGRGTIDGNAANTNQNLVGHAGGQVGGFPVAADAKYLYWANSVNLMRSDLNGQNVAHLTTLSAGARWLAVDTKYIYLGTDSFVGRVNLDGTGYVERWLNYSKFSLGLAVDVGHLYWLSADGIGRANLDGTGIDNAFIPGAVGSAVGVDGQHIYWSNSVTGTIGRANLDGSGVDSSFISGLFTNGSNSLAGVRGLAFDFEHIYWVNYYNCTRGSPPCGGGGIGRANLDGTGVDETFLESGTTSTVNGCNTSPPTRCGPTTLAISGPIHPGCVRTTTPPQPPPGGAVFWRPPGAAGTSNTVILAPGTSWTPGGPCSGTAAGSQQVMTSPTSITVAPGAAVSLADSTHGLISAWGGQTTPSGGPAPVLFPGRSDWQTTSASLMTPEQLLQSSGGCAGCEFPDDATIAPLAPSPTVAYDRDVSGAVLNGATVAGDFSGFDFSGAELAGATLNGTDVSGADFTGADLRGAHMTSLVTNAPPKLANVRIGALDGACTLFKNSDLVGTGIAPVQADALVTGCESFAMFPDSEIPIAVVALLSRTYEASIDYSDATIVVTAGNSAALAGADLHGIHLAGASFIGFPANLQKTKFDGASLMGTSMQLADLSNATFLGATATTASFQDAVLQGAQFTSSTTNLTNADFAGADVSSASFQNATLTGAVFDDALANGTSFDSVVATNSRFVGAHVYGLGDAFEGARELTGADFTDAVLGGADDGTAGLDFTNANLTNAKFDDAQCVGCNFSNAILTGVTVTDAYLPGAQLSTATLQGASFDGTWLYCGSLAETACKSSGTLEWPLKLGSQEDYGPVDYATTTLTQGAWSDVTLCPDATSPTQGGLEPDCGGGHMLANRPFSLAAIACSAVALDACPTLTSTLDQTSAPQAVVPATPPTWPSGVSQAGYYVAGADSAVRLVDPSSGGAPSLVAGTPGDKCSPSTAVCGDGGPAIGALLDNPTGLAVGLDGSLYIADPGLNRVRRIAPGGTITTVAGNGQTCAAPTDACGDGGQAAAAALADPQGVWVSPSGQIFIADGKRGIRRVGLDGTISTLSTGTPGTYDIVSVAGDADGIIWAAANNPDYILEVDLGKNQTTQAVGTGTSGYNGNSDPNTGTPASGADVQVNAPHSLSVALNGDVVFADTANHLIRAYNPGQDTVID
ncbi:MAG: pentapeptide repeat-containing protein, partial [Solirubrobacteraceae bacterium]